MIKDHVALLEIQSSWEGVRAMQERIGKQTLFGFAQGAVLIGGLASIAQNIPFLQACSVLGDGLLQLRDEGVFSCPRFFLGALHKASKDALPWVDWLLIKVAIEKRNDVAHDALLVPADDCRKYVEAIERELIAFGIVNREQTA